jgi:3'-phosphoadenosine 5'-phosphosulfate sulfotransferase (PAPS reductase)/FAD synthetase
MDSRKPIVVSYGGGVNSTALLCGFIEKNIRPALILFADTGGEHDETLDYVAVFSAWLVRCGYPPITTVKYDWGPNETLETESLVNGTLPSLAFGFKGCSVKWKRQPMDRYIKAWTNEPVVRAVGIHAGEAHRGRIENTKQFEFWFPLIEWNWWQRDCESIIQRHGHPLPRKSSCWFCPAKTKAEVRKQAIERPDLHARCVEMENNARDAGGLHHIKGLGRHWSWETVAKADAAQVKLLPDISFDSPCGCWDGECPRPET